MLSVFFFVINIIATLVGIVPVLFDKLYVYKPASVSFVLFALVLSSSYGKSLGGFVQLLVVTVSTHLFP